MSPSVIIVMLIVLQIADILTTVKALKQGGTEINPIARKLFGALGPLPSAILLKLLGTIPMIALVMFFPSYWVVGLAYSFVLLGVVANNWFSLD